MQHADVRDLAEDMTSRSEEQVRLPLPRWEPGQERQQVRVLGHRRCQSFVSRRASRRLEARESAVVLRYRLSFV
jgi:hypothetical protein